MTDAVTKDCPVCNSPSGARERFATVEVAEHLKEKARRDESHREWLDEHTTNGTLVEIRTALQSKRNPQ